MSSGVIKNAFISYRGAYYEHANAIRHWLIGNGYCKNVVLFPPNSLSIYGELLMPYEYIELMEFILDRLSRCDAFVFLNTPDYSNSYFTQAEILQWRRFRDNPMVFPIGQNVDQYVIGQGIQLVPLTLSEKRLWANLSVNIARSYQGKFNPGFYGGKHNRNCYLMPCGICGEHFLIGKKATSLTLRGEYRIVCPHCNNSHFRILEGNQMGTFYRNPIIVEQEFIRPLRVLETSEVLDLLIKDDLPPRIPLVSLADEHFDNDLIKVGKFFLGGLAALAAGALVINALGNEGQDGDK